MNKENEENEDEEAENQFIRIKSLSGSCIDYLYDLYAKKKSKFQK